MLNIKDNSVMTSWNFIRTCF